MSSNVNTNDCDWTTAIIAGVITLGLIAVAFFWFVNKVEEGPAQPTEHQLCMRDKTNRLAGEIYAYQQTGKSSGNMYEIYANAKLQAICENKKVK